jgi:hypothetical protein
VEILVTHKPKLVRLAEYLIEHETVSGDQLNGIIGDDEFGGEPGTPAVPPTPPPYSPPPLKPLVPQPAPTLSSQSDPSPAPTPAEPEM